MQRVTNRSLILLGLAMAMAWRGAGAFDFVPTSAEWSAWPDYCRAKYSTLSLDSVFNSGYYGRVSPQDVANARSQVGSAWEGVHHHCAGLANLQRALAARDAGSRDRLLKQAYSDTQYTLVRTDPASALYAPMAVQMGVVARARGQWMLAITHFEAAMAARPEYPAGYQGVAMVRRERGELAEARDVLRKGDEATGGSSPDIHYALGLVLVDMKDFEAARDEARRAYELGYPLPGLRRKLAAAGYPLD